MNFWQTVVSWFQSLLTAIKQYTPPTPTPTPTPTPVTPSPVTPTPAPVTQTMQAKVAALIAQYNGPMGPSLTTGGIIHQTTAAQNAQVSQLIVQYANPAAGFPVSLFLAWVMAESLGDQNAVNPNHQVAKPGETPEQAFLHTDIGIAQIDGSELAGFPDLAGMTWQQQEQTAFDPTWAIPAMAEICLGLIAWANQQQTTAGSDPAWGLDPYVLACSAYNLGRTGALKTGASYKYGTGVVARWATYAAALGDPGPKSAEAAA